jgi:hypothetical protein
MVENLALVPPTVKAARVFTSISQVKPWLEAAQDDATRLAIGDM